MLDFDIHLERCNCKYMCASWQKVFEKHILYIKHSNAYHTMKFYRSKYKYCGGTYTRWGAAYLNHVKKYEGKKLKSQNKEYKKDIY